MVTYIFTTDSDEDAIWKRIIINGCYTYYVVNSKGVFKNAITGRIMKYYINKKDPRKVYMSLQVPDLKQQCRVVAARVVGALFVKLPRNYNQTDVNIGFFDGDVSNINAENLYWWCDDVNVKIRGGLSSTQVDVIIYLYQSKKLSTKEIAEYLNIDYYQAYNVLYQNIKDFRGSSYRKFSKEEVVNICKMLQDEKPIKEIASMYECSYERIYGIKARKYYRNISKDYEW